MSGILQTNQAVYYSYSEYLRQVNCCNNSTQLEVGPVGNEGPVGAKGAWGYPGPTGPVGPTGPDGSGCTGLAGPDAPITPESNEVLISNFNGFEIGATESEYVISLPVLNPGITGATGSFTISGSDLIQLIVDSANNTNGYILHSTN